MREKHMAHIPSTDIDRAVRLEGRIGRDDREVYLAIRQDGQEVECVVIHTTDLVAAINELPGVTATYTKPAPPVPQGIGAVIQSAKATYTRINAEGYGGWRTLWGTAAYDDTEIALVLEGGGIIRSVGVTL